MNELRVHPSLEADAYFYPVRDYLPVYHEICAMPVYAWRSILELLSQDEIAELCANVTSAIESDEEIRSMFFLKSGVLTGTIARDQKPDNYRIALFYLNHAKLFMTVYMVMNDKLRPVIYLT